MPRDGVKIATDGAHIDRHMHRCLAAINQHRHAFGRSTRANRFHIDNAAQNIRHMGHSDEFGARAYGINHRLRVKIAVRVTVNPFQHHALTFAQQVPRNDIGVVFHDRQNDLVAGLQARGGPSVRYQIDAFGCTGGEDDLVLGAVQKARNLAAHRFIAVGGKVGQIVQATVNIGIFVRISLGYRINHHLWLLCRGPVVKVNQRLAVDLPVQNGKVSADAVHVIHWAPIL